MRTTSSGLGYVACSLTASGWKFILVVVMGKWRSLMSLSDVSWLSGCGGRKVSLVFVCALAPCLHEWCWNISCTRQWFYRQCVCVSVRKSRISPGGNVDTKSRRQEFPLLTLCDARVGTACLTKGMQSLYQKETARLFHWIFYFHIVVNHTLRTTPQI